MAYDTNVLFDQALTHINRKKLFTFRDVIAFLGISTSTFYAHFPKESNAYKEMDLAMRTHKASMKLAIRKDWLGSKDKGKQAMLYKLLADEDELRRLTNYNMKHDGEIKMPDFSKAQWLDASELPEGDLPKAGDG